MKAWDCRNAFYLVICFTDKDYKKAKTFIKESEQTHYYHSFINILILDARVENKKFKRVNRSKLKKEVPLKIDTYFKNIDRMSTLSKVDQIIKYLDVLKNNYNDIEDSNLKRDYVKKVKKICYDDTYMILNIDRFVNPDCFYQVIKPNYAPNKLLLKLVNDDNLERDFNSAIDNIKGIYEQMEDIDNKDNLTEKQINEIILFLKQEHNDFYKILQSISLRIYLFNKSNKYINFNTITNMNLTEFVIVCYSVCKSHKYNKIYLFLNELGFMLSCLVLKKFDNEIENLFKEFDFPYNKQDAQEVFSSFFAIYLMNNTKYQKYIPYHFLPQSVYIKLEKYFKKLLKNMRRNHD